MVGIEGCGAGGGSMTGEIGYGSNHHGCSIDD